MAPIQQLPFDVLDEVITNLKTKDFLSFTSACKQFRETLYNDSGYWKAATINTFRVRNRPSTANDGILWRKLYRRLQTQTRVYMWGKSSDNGEPQQLHLGANGEPDPSVIADLQCGGWCTALLNDRGEILVKGKLDGELYNPHGINHNFAKLTFPSDAPEGTTTIRQLSVGRKHILGLTDDGTVWLWYGTAPAGKRLEFFSWNENSKKDERLLVTNIVAGWATSAVYLKGKGIMQWEYVSPLTIDGRYNERFMSEDDSILIPQTNWTSKQKAVARSAYGNKPLGEASEVKQALESKHGRSHPGEVKNFVLLEHFLLFCTDEGELFVHKTGSEASLSIPNLDFVLDVQGSFRSFAIFTHNGSVLTSSQDALEAFWTAYNDTLNESTSLAFVRIPALQNAGVIQIAFGDYHFHALHSNGKITSYGKDPQTSGALGLGKSFDRVSARGVLRTDGWSQDSEVSQHSVQRGRAVWLLEEQRDWADFVSDALKGSPLAEDEAAIGALSDWMEQAGSNWGESMIANDDGLGPFFALSVAAGGWSGGALVLVNLDLIEAIKRVIANRLPEAQQDNSDASNESAQHPDRIVQRDVSKWRHLFGATANGIPDLDATRDDIFIDDNASRKSSDLSLRTTSYLNHPD